MKILTAAEMREVDRLTIERYRIPGLILMESAARSVVAAVEERLGRVSGKKALVICGRGNNGGDGAAVARQLALKGCAVDCLLIGRIEAAEGDARTNFEMARAMAAIAGSRVRFVEIADGEQLRREASLHRHDYVFDAIFGTGLTRPAEGIFRQAIDLLNERGSSAPVVSVDMPSGLGSDSHEVIGAAVFAQLTVTFTAPKIANILPPASGHNGRLVVAPIGSPDELIVASGSRLSLISPETVGRWLRESRRGSDANKGDAGKVLIVAGSRGKTGAACLAGEGAMRAGAGLVTVATAESAQQAIAARLIAECMTERLAETDSGEIAREAADRVIALASERNVLAIGPGLGSPGESTRSLVRQVIDNRPGPVVIDADGLNALAPWEDDLRGSHERPLILTPHPGEMARLTGLSISEVLRDRLRLAREFATRHEVILVLKGSRSLVAAPDGEVYINPTGNSGMATGGSGDVLTGILAGLLAQKQDDAVAATVASVFLHGVAGDIAASRRGTRAMIASDISAHLGDAFIEIGGPQERAVEESHLD